VGYDEYLESDHWRAIRRLVLERDGNHCMVCGRSDVKLHVHHNSYERFGNENLSDLVSLCAYCHHLFHNANGDIETPDEIEEQLRALYTELEPLKRLVLSVEYDAPPITKETSDRVSKLKREIRHLEARL
jgi:hypothetical protein